MAIANYFKTYHELVLSRVLSGQTGLYPHQREALLALYQKAVGGEMDGLHRQAALILAGVGTGKTLIQALTPFILAPWMPGERALFLSDNCTLRDRFLRDFPTDPQGRPHYQQWWLYRLNILPPGVPPPTIVGLDASNFNSYAYAMHCADILVGNRQFVVNLVNRGDIEPESMGILIVDEAHFAAASSYRTITGYFDKALLTYFTGSKFRSDSQPLPYVRYAEVSDWDVNNDAIVHYAPIADYEFSLQDAWKLDPPPIKKVTLQEATSEAFLIEEEGEEISYTPEEFFNKAECDRLWFRKILFADNFSLPVLQKTVEILLAKRQQTGQPHAAIVRALNIPHVHRVSELLEKNFPVLKGRIGSIHSDREGFDLAGRPGEIIQRFYNGDFWVLVHCGMVGVGFDHPWASVSCCLCVLKSLSPAEQEWGRIVRRVPGESPGYFPRLEHPNWGVVVTHESLDIRPLFEKFFQGMESDTITDIPPPRPHPVLVSEYEAGETVLNLSDTSSLRSGDILQLSTWVESQPTPPPKFNLTQELASTSVAESKSTYNSEATVNPQPLSVNNSESLISSSPPSSSPNTDSQLPITHHPSPITQPWQTEVDAIAENLEKIRSLRTFNIQVEAVLDEKHVQIAPTWNDIPRGAKIKRERTPQSLPDAHFLSHVNLDWQVMVGDELMSYTEYKKREILQQKGFNLDEDGEIVANGVKLRSLMPDSAYQLFLKGLEAELSNTDVDVPQNHNAIARPDKAKLETQGRYGGQIRSLIHDLLRQRCFVPDGKNGTFLLTYPVPLLQEEIDRVETKGEEVSFKNNQQFLHSAVFAYIKEATGRSFSEHNEEQYREVYQLARIYLLRLREQLQWQSK
ncbi:MAG: DEAD/DEAH box helicase [Spirulina sp.]